ncbi:MAG TPA: EfeM/EfeO family lipoprotein [Solirubrobacteraceae bacterium]|nr:EfeM/EfeO family lipoprotein [Solirubrobacteraceae bacterium]
MPRGRTALALGLAALLAAGFLAVFVGPGGHSGGVSAAPASASAGAPALATYSEQAPHVASILNAYGVEGGVRGESGNPADPLPPVSAAAFAAPVAAYERFSVRQLQSMQPDIAQLQAALAAGNRGAAEAAWRSAYADYLELGGVYLEGPVASLNQAIDGTPGGLPGGVASRRFTGLHRLEYGLWTGQALAPLVPVAERLSANVSQLARLLPGTTISPLDYATRAHEILEDAVRDLLSGTDVPWSGEGVLGTSAGLTATTEIVGTLAPLLKNREGVLPVVNTELAGLRSTLSGLAAAHGGRLPTNSELSQEQSERLDAATGQALEALAQVPGALEAAPAQATPQIPASAAQIDP